MRISIVKRLTQTAFLKKIRYNLETSQIDSYHCRKNTIREQKIKQKFIPTTDKLVEKCVDMSSMVPNFFAKKLTIKELPKTKSKDNKTNHLQNSYVQLQIPLSKEKELRQKFNRLFDHQVRIGRLFEVMDSIAGLVSYRHCFLDIGELSPTHSHSQDAVTCVTGSVEYINLFDGIKINEDILIQGYLNHVGRTSMEVQIYLYQNGLLKLTSLFTMIARDNKNLGKGYPVPALDLQNLNSQEKDKALIRLKEAELNVVRRKIQMESAYDKTPPSTPQVQQIHSMFLRRRAHQTYTLKSIPIGSTVMTNNFIMHTQLRNVHGKIFGGHLMRQMYEMGWILGLKFSEDVIQIQDLTNIYFKKAVDIGTRLTLKAQVTYTQKNRIVVTVQAYTSKFNERTETMACFLHIIFKTKNDQQAVHPQSYEEALQYLSARKSFQEIFHIT